MVEKLKDKKVQREWAKGGLIATVAGATLTGMTGSKGAHTALGVGMLAFSAWHYCLYPKKKKRAAAAQGC